MDFTSKIKKLLKSGKEGIIMNFLKKKKNCAHLKSMIPMKSKLELSHRKIYKAIHGVHELLSLEQEQFLSPMLEYDQIIAVIPKLVCILKSSRDFFFNSKTQSLFPSKSQSQVVGHKCIC